MIIAIDFDGTCVSHDFPNVGKDIGAVPVLKELVKKGHKLILYTMRSDIANPQPEEPEINPAGGRYLTTAIQWFKDHDIPLYGIQSNPTQRKWTQSPKPYAHLYIDDAALGCPLKLDKAISYKPFVDWKEVRRLLIEREIL